MRSAAETVDCDPCAEHAVAMILADKRDIQRSSASHSHIRLHSGLNLTYVERALRRGDPKHPIHSAPHKRTDALATYDLMITFGKGSDIKDRLKDGSLLPFIRFHSLKDVPQPSRPAKPARTAAELATQEAEIARILAEDRRRMFYIYLHYHNNWRDRGYNSFWGNCESARPLNAPPPPPPPPPPNGSGKAIANGSGGGIGGDPFAVAIRPHVEPHAPLPLTRLIDVPTTDPKTTPDPHADAWLPVYRPLEPPYFFRDTRPPAAEGDDWHALALKLAGQMQVEDGHIYGETLCREIGKSLASGQRTLTPAFVSLAFAQDAAARLPPVSICQDFVRSIPAPAPAPTSVPAAAAATGAAATGAAATGGENYTVTPGGIAYLIVHLLTRLSLATSVALAPEPALPDRIHADDVSGPDGRAAIARAAAAAASGADSAPSHNNNKARRPRAGNDIEVATRAALRWHTHEDGASVELVHLCFTQVGIEVRLVFCPCDGHDDDDDDGTVKAKANGSGKDEKQRPMDELVIVDWSTALRYRLERPGTPWTIRLAEDVSELVEAIALQVGLLALRSFLRRHHLAAADLALLDRVATESAIAKPSSLPRQMSSGEPSQAIMDAVLRVSWPGAEPLEPALRQAIRRCLACRAPWHVGCVPRPPRNTPPPRQPPLTGAAAAAVAAASAGGGKQAGKHGKSKRGGGTARGRGRGVGAAARGKGSRGGGKGGRKRNILSPVTTPESSPASSPSPKRKKGGVKRKAGIAFAGVVTEISLEESFALAAAKTQAQQAAAARKAAKTS